LNVASSSLSLEGNVLPCASVSATTTVTFVLDRNIQWVSGVNMYFVLYSSNVTSNFRIQARSTGGENWRLYISATSSIPLTSYEIFSSNAQYEAITAKIYALGNPPVNQNQGIYNASTTAAVCETFDIGCYITTAISWAFYPTATIYIWENLDPLTAKFPFSYISDLSTAYSNFDNPTSTLSTLNIPYGGVMGSATGTIEFLSLADVSTGSASGLFDTLKYIISVVLYLWLLRAIWKYIRMWVLIFGSNT